MKYLDIHKKQKLQNTEVDKFLSELHALCKKHKKCITTQKPAYALYVTDYSKNSVKHMLSNVVLDLPAKTKDKKDEK
jgi:hypothetical protein